MAQYISLYSGSSGNCSIVEDKGKFIIIDMGKSARLTTQGINSLGLDMKNLQGILVSHEHSDHISGLKVFLKKINVPVFSNVHSLDYMADFDCLPGHIDAQEMNFSGTNIGPFFIQGFDTPHDSSGCMGYKIHTEQGTTMAIATDLGTVNDNILGYLNKNDLVVLESNYDEKMLKEGSYPYYLKSRISSNRGHLSNVQSSNTAVKLIDNGLTKLHLCHLSNNNNTPQLALDQLTETALKNGIILDNSIKIVANKRHDITPSTEF